MEHILTNQKEKKSKLFFVLLVSIAILINIKYIFVDFGIDAEFQISMSYRLVKGDILFKEMWEPYQMSTFLSAFFIKIWMWLFDTTTGIALFLQVMGSLIDASISYLLYRTVYKYFGNRKAAILMAWLFYLIAPKDVPLPEYANMQIWFAMLLCLALFRYYKENKTRDILMAAVWMCAMILSYPSCLVVFAGVVVLLLILKKSKGIWIFGGTCLLLGLGYLGIIFLNVSLSDFLAVISNMIAIETSHAMSAFDKFVWYLTDMCKLAAVLGSLLLIPYLCLRLVKKPQTKEEKDVVRLWANVIFFFAVFGISLYTVCFCQSNWRFYYSIIFLCIIGIGLQYRKELQADEKIFYLICMTVSVVEFISTLLLTNLEIIVSVPYLLIATIASFLPVSRAIRKEELSGLATAAGRVAILALILLISFRSVFIIRPMWKYVFNVFEVANVVKEGPAIGIFSEYMGPYMQNETIKEWNQYIDSGDTIYLIGGSLDTLGYLYADTEIGAPSLVPTPGYNETILEYWKMNPHKYPDVIVASCWYGVSDVELTQDSWIMKWIQDEYKPSQIVDGKYWRYYIK